MKYLHLAASSYDSVGCENWLNPLQSSQSTLWTLLRLEILYAAWSARCGRHGSGKIVQAAGVAAMLVAIARMRKHIELDCVRTSANVRRLSSAAVASGERIPVSPRGNVSLQ